MSDQDERQIKAFYADGSSFGQFYEAAGRGVAPPGLEEKLHAAIRETAADTGSGRWLQRLLARLPGRAAERAMGGEARRPGGSLPGRPAFVPAAAIGLAVIGFGLYFALAPGPAREGTSLLSEDSPKQFQGAPVELTGLRDAVPGSDAQPSLAELLQRIEELREQGRVEEAERALDKLRELYPDRIPAQQ